MLRRSVCRVVVLAVTLSMVAACGSSRARPVDAMQSVRAEPGSVQPMQPAERQLLRRGDMQVEVEQVPPAQARLERAVGLLGGRIDHVQSTEENARYTLRVPADRLDRLMDSVATLGKVERRTVSAVDVTEQVMDAEARLEALRASRNRLQQLLARAETVQDVVAVERELARVQGELDSLESRLNALRGQVALSELTVHLQRKRVLGPVGLLFVGAAKVVEKLVFWR